MKKFQKTLLILSLFLLSNSNLFFQDRNNFIDKNIIKSSQDDDDYIFIWDEFNNASGDIKGDDSLAFGPSLSNFHNYTEIILKCFIP